MFTVHVKTMNILKAGQYDLALTVRESNRSYAESTNNALSPVIILAQFFGLMPLYGIANKTCNSIRFQWKSLRFVYSMYNLIGAFLSATFCFLRFALVGVMIDKLATMAFYICSFFGIFYFMKIARSWKFIMQEWSSVEISMGHYLFQPKLRTRFLIMTTVFMGLAFAEHLLFIISGIHSKNKCTYGNKTNVQAYFEITFPHVFCVTTYTIWKAVLVEVANILTTFSWNFNDLFIMLLSSSLALRFRQINERLENTECVHEIYWKYIREDYSRLTRLCKTVDEYIAPLVIISFVNNLFFICVQLHNTMKPRYGLIEVLYFFYSFGFLLSRTIAVSLYAAWINDESIKPLRHIYSIPTENFSTEVNRLMQQICSYPVGLTGSNFFLVTRSLLLRVAGTIVTFELMLLQFGPILYQDGSEICSP